MKEGWIGVDLDGTLAQYDGWISEDHIGEPIAYMQGRVLKWLAKGVDVRIFTARVDGGEVAISMGEPAGEKFRDVEKIKNYIEAWCLKHLGKILPITNKKDFGMVELWDDRCVQVIKNTGFCVAELIDEIDEDVTLEELVEMRKSRGI